MMSSPLQHLSRVDVYVSIVLDSDLDSTWKHARDFGHAPFWSQAGRAFSVRKLKGRAASEIGSGRMFRAGGGRLYEKLTALDDCKHNMRWMLVSHPHTLSPFGDASFLNYSSRLRFRKVTNTNETFGEWKGEFYTEPQYAEEMESVLSGWYSAGFEGLQVSAGGSDSRQTVSKAALQDPRRQVPVTPPAHEQTTFHGPGYDDSLRQDLAQHMTNWALRKFKWQDEQVHTPEAHHFHPGAPQGRASNSSQQHSSTHHGPGSHLSNSTDQWQPSSPRTAPIEDTITRRSDSTSTSNSRQSNNSRYPAPSHHQNRAAHMGNGATGMPYPAGLQNAHPSGDYFSSLRPITEDSPMSQPDWQNSAAPNTYPHSQHPRGSDAQAYPQAPHVPYYDRPEMQQNPNASNFRGPVPGMRPNVPPQNGPSQYSMSSSKSQASLTGGMQSKSSLESVSRSSILSGGSQNNMHMQHRMSARNSQADLTDYSFAHNEPAGPVPTNAPSSRERWNQIHCQETQSQHSGHSGGSYRLHKASSLGVPNNSQLSQDTFNGVRNNFAKHEQNPWTACEPQCMQEAASDELERSSLDEQVSFMQERHQALHGEGRSSTVCSSPFAHAASSSCSTQAF